MSSQIDSTKPAPKIDPCLIHTRYSSLISRADAVTRIHYSVCYYVGILFFKNFLSKPTSRAASPNINDDFQDNDCDDDNKDNNNDDYVQWNYKILLILVSPHRVFSLSYVPVSPTRSLTLQYSSYKFLYYGLLFSKSKPQRRFLPEKLVVVQMFNRTPHLT
jgi:hypothetical protein